MDSTTQQAMAQAIRVQRIRAGFGSDADLARAADYSPSGLSKRLTGEVHMDLEDVDRIAKALGLHDGFDLMDVARAERTHLAAA